MKNYKTLDRLLRVKHLRIAQSERSLQQLAANRQVAEHTLQQLRSQLRTLECSDNNEGVHFAELESKSRHARYLESEISKAEVNVQQCVEAWKYARDEHSQKVSEATPLENLRDAKREEWRERLIRIEQTELDDHVLRKRN